MSEETMDPHGNTRVNKTVDAMCMTVRHDFGLDRNSDTALSSGMTDSERASLRGTMGQLYDHHVRPLEERIGEQDAILNLVRDALARSNPNRPLAECVGALVCQMERQRDVLVTIRDTGLTAVEAADIARDVLSPQEYYPANPLLARFARVLWESSLIASGTHRGMRVSGIGVLTHGARALNEMAEPLDSLDDETVEAHQERLADTQPRYHAHGLEMMANHIAMLRAAFENGDAEAVRKFFDVYVFE